MENSLGNYIRSERNVRGLTLRELASKLDMDVSSLVKIERNYRQFPKGKLQLLANIFNVSLDRVLIEFLKTDLHNSYGDFPDIKKLIFKALESNGEPHTLQKTIEEGETKKVEFKSTLRLCLKSLKPERHIEHSAMKNICAFLNSEGGKLIIGVTDDKEIIGLENTDYTTFKENDKKDAWLKHFDNLIFKYFGNAISNLIIISFENISAKTVACIDVLPNNVGPTVLKNLEKNNSEEFFVRRNASAVTLTMTEYFQYSKERW